MSGSIVEKLKSAGIAARVVPLEALKKAREEYGRIDRSSFVWQRYYSHLQLDAPQGGPERSILITASRSAAVRVTFCGDEGNKSFLLPPTYLARERMDVKERVESALRESGCEAVKSGFPHKLLAVISGLAVYGRNNVAYAGDFGSYALLQTYVTSLEPESGTEPVTFAKACAECRACASACPTGAVAKDSYRINAARCITTVNETDEPFPDWIPVDAHNCIVGCMRCQLACPMNRGKLETKEGPVFGEEETRALLLGTAFGELPGTAREKIRDINYEGGYTGFARNVKALLCAAGE
jgi:epoxyqueuosine reductase